ncbi:MAG: hypothetical protein JJ902_23040 [Roseibium sp.]|nr:hypothetical protein [Roseibium sp.]
MITSIDKALTAIVMAVLYLLSTFAGIDLGLSEEFVSGIIAGLTPLLVWLVPNKSRS